MAKKQSATKASDVAEPKKAEEEYWRRQQDSFVLPPEIRLTIRDGFRFGIGLVLAMLVFYVVAIVGVVLLLRLGPTFNIR